ncbi:MAG: hypothetical protein A2Y94_04890 [Caldithrix sp. RBG_13_44_9]|nr:MAG: hypothetical protein A2Y94_04890 [Caldithrix sp. RBG_13_44_9]
MSQLLKELEEKYRPGVELLKEKGYYEQTISEVYYLIKYLDANWVVRLLSENLFSDIQGVFSLFIREELKDIYHDLEVAGDLPLNDLLNRNYVNLEILLKCATSLNYQVKSIMKTPDVRNLKFKSRFLEIISRKFNGEIQSYFKILQENYKKYFRKKFTFDFKEKNIVSLQCLRNLASDYDMNFISEVLHFQALSAAIHFVKDLFMKELENKVNQQIQPIVNHHHKFNKLIIYFINDLKRSFIQSLIQQFRKGKNFDWIKSGLEEYIHSERFARLLKKVIFQTFSIIHTSRPRAEFQQK